MTPSPSAAPVTREMLSSRRYAQRFGKLMQRHRRDRGEGLRSLARRRGLTSNDLRAFERGERSLDPFLVERLCDLYGIPMEEVAADHDPLIIDLESGELRVGAESIAIPDTDDPTPALERYLGMIKRLRGKPMTNPATLRRDDTSVLAEALELDVEEVAALLHDLIGHHASTRRKVLALRSSSGTLAAVVVIGAASVTLAPEGGDDGADRSEAAPLTAADVTEPEFPTLEISAPPAAPSGPVPPDLQPYPEGQASEDDEPADPPGHEDDQPSGQEEAGAAPDSRAEAPDEPVRIDRIEEDDESGHTDVDAPGGPEVTERDDEEGTNIDAPDGPTAIEREDEGETDINAPGGPVVIERIDE